MGWVNAAVFAFAYSLAKASGNRLRLVRYRFVAQPVEPKPRVASRAHESLRIAQVTRDDAITAAFPRPAEVVANRFKQGAVCLAARSGERFAGYIWLARGPYDEDEVRCRYVTLPETNTAWDFDLYVSPPFRMGRCFLKLWDAANAYLRERHVEWTLSRIDAFNMRSFKAHERLGMRQLGMGNFLLIGNVQLAMLTLPPFFHLSLNAASRPVIRLRSPRSPVARRDGESVERHAS